jgi:hypothetical protein
VRHYTRRLLQLMNTINFEAEVPSTTKREKRNKKQEKEKICAVRESNPKLNLGRVSCYHYTNGAIDERLVFLNYK